MAALVPVAPDLRTIFAAQVALQLVDRRRLRTADDIERDGLMRVAAEAANLEISVAGVYRVADGRRGLCRSLVAEHPVVPGFAGEPIGHLARCLGAFGGGGDGAAVDSLACPGGHPPSSR